MSTLYLVDDHVIVREGLSAVLVAHGHQVLGETADLTQAMADLLRLRPQVLLLDINLGERSGFELLAQVQRRALAMQSVVLTMSAQPHHVAEALRLGAVGYVLKGSPTRDLLDAITDAVHGKRHLGPQVAELAVQALTGQAGADPLAALSPRERQIVTMVATGQSSAAIGAQLHLSPKTVDTYRSRLMARMGIGDTAALVRWAVRNGLIDAGR
jgi:two-component system, NarL family, invasion response regulator UvrY